MSYFAKLDSNDKVIDLIVADQEFIDSGAVGDPSQWVETCLKASFRGTYAQIGGTYNREKDKFVPMQPYPSWTYDFDLNKWVAPKPIPVEGHPYIWDESLQDWILVEWELSEEEKLAKQMAEDLLNGV